MEQGLISLGFVVVTPHRLVGWEDKSVPPVFYTPFSFLCELYPDSRLLGQAQDIKLAEQYVTLGLTEESGIELQKWLWQIFKAERWGYDSVFVYLEDAQEFMMRWGYGIAGLKILETALPMRWLKGFLPTYVMDDAKHTHQGRELAARLKRLPLPGLELGFEVLGVSHWSDAHTSACSDIRQDFQAGFGATFNTHGFLTTLEQAELAAREYMFESDGSGIEDCEWFPIQVSEVQWTP